MRIGISICSNYPRVDGRDGARFMVARAAAAKSADLDSLFVGDHHVTRSNYYQNVPMLGRMLAEWGDRPAGALFLLPLWNPVLLAEQVATLACLAEGRFILQCGLGGEQAQSEGLGVDFSRRVGMFESAVNVMRALWAGEVVNEDRYWHIRDAQIRPLPPEPIDIWVGAMAPPAIRRTARMAEGWLASPSLTVSQAGEAVGRYQQSCAEFARQPTAVAIRQDVCVMASDDAARAAVAPVLERGYRGFDERALAIGSVDTVAEHFRALENVGYTDVIVRNISQDQDVAIETIERLAQVKALLAA